MIIKKTFKFYAAHRNEEIGGKCANLHGHRYGIECFFEVRRRNSISTPFAEFDERVGSLIKKGYDHGMLIHRGDPLYQTLSEHMRVHGEHLKLKVLDGPTSVENLAYTLFSEISALVFALMKIEVRETDTSVVEYTLSDWKADRAKFAWRRDDVHPEKQFGALGVPSTSFSDACVTVLDTEA
tara:strand:- start:24 stop:569 length:546 start_codon:yes stop_codon:yes gene_type:complete